MHIIYDGGNGQYLWHSSVHCTFITRCGTFGLHTAYHMPIVKRY